MAGCEELLEHVERGNGLLFIGERIYEGFPPDVLRAQSEDMALMFEWFDRTGYAADIEAAP